MAVIEVVVHAVAELSSSKNDTGVCRRIEGDGGVGSDGRRARRR
ncbi:MAG: hypothetical protein ACI9KE_005985 [Polyangiales bacterium]|jgi:hypothetical protein